MQRACWTADFAEANIVAGLLRANGIDASVFDAGMAQLNWMQTLAVGGYRLAFAIGEHFKASGLPVSDPPFLDVVVIDFAVSNTEQHWHVPLLVSPYGYSTYRGS